MKSIFLLASFVALGSCASSIKTVAPNLDPQDTAQVRFYKSLSEKALENPAHYFDQRLDTVTTTLHANRYDEGIRTWLAGRRDTARNYFSNNPEATTELLAAGGGQRCKHIDPVDLATWIAVTSAVDHMTQFQKEMLE